VFVCQQQKWKSDKTENVHGCHHAANFGVDLHCSCGFFAFSLKKCGVPRMKINHGQADYVGGNRRRLQHSKRACGGVIQSLFYTGRSLSMRAAVFL